MNAGGRDRARAWSVAIAQALRDAGVPVGVGQAIACERALVELGSRDVEQRYQAGRICLLSSPEHVAVFDRVFAHHERAVSGPGPTAGPVREEPVPGSGSDRGAESGGHGGSDQLRSGARASERERLRGRRFDTMTDDERRRIGEMLQQLRVVVPRRPSRRRRPGRGSELDLARTLERAMQTDGELIDRAWRRRRARPRRLVVLLDVSGSMADHARVMLRFAVAARRTAEHDPTAHVEVFAFGTRLTRLSDALSARDPDRAIAAAADEVADWDGGTRIGASIDELVRRWGRRGLLRGAVVVICSDGLERGDPAALAAAMARLRRHVHRILWVNPLAGDGRFAPTQRGMAAAMPHVDELLSGHTLASLEELVARLEAMR